MDFDEMKVIWDSQNDEPLYVIDQAGLHARVESVHRKFKRNIFWRDVREIGIGLVAGIVLIAFGLNAALADASWLTRLFGFESSERWIDILCLMVAGVAWLYYSGYQFVGRSLQERREGLFESSLRGDLNRAISHVEYQIKLSKNALWWGSLPIFVATALTFVVILKPEPGYQWILDPVWLVLILGSTLLLIVADLRCKKRPIKDELLPRKRDFEALRDKLIDSENEINSGDSK